VAGAVNELSERHVAGWAFDPRDPQARVEVEAVLDGAILARARADQFSHGLSAATGGDGAQGFYLRLPRVLPPAERARLLVRPVGGAALPPAGWVRAEYNPLMHVAMDIVDNCNLRCPFCLYDYAGTHATQLMDEPTLDAALRFLPYTRDGEFWFSCLHEPTLHPRLVDFIDRVPREYRRKLFFTTNLAKRMPPSYFAWLAASGLHHINISVESRDPALYERLRAGARHRIFTANWAALLAAWPAADAGAAPRLRYIAMAYKSNLRELPDLVSHLLMERRADQVEVRYTYDVPHIPADFKAAEYLEPADWRWLRDQLAPHLPGRVMLLAPPADAPVPVPSAEGGHGGVRPPPADPVLAGRYMFRLSWDGSLRVVGVLSSSRRDEARDHPMLSLNVRDITDPEAFFERLEGAR